MQRSLAVCLCMCQILCLLFAWVGGRVHKMTSLVSWRSYTWRWSRGMQQAWRENAAKLLRTFVIVFIHTSYIHAADTVALAAFQQRQIFN